ncbi:hypothetical protein [Nonomuraea turcica]|uniref:hypothetical protein n=1 Tax=Nonomuraea sp. G32 TaxID=3067274 RepID=UPI00273B1486|nr:hypothetical protein [Nonomuraea sp. G32]MDP4511789.1 hypothetical protein [Nonomuraea sp. G32]
MSSVRTRFAATLAAATLVGGLGLSASPAHAAGWTCSASWASKSFDLPGKPDATVWARGCIYKDGSTRAARIEYKWSSGTAVDDRRFDKFVIQTRLERYDLIQTTRYCDITDEINHPSENSGEGHCTTLPYTSSLTGGWTSDGKIIYNINSDGKGDFEWNLPGSPQVTVA